MVAAFLENSVYGKIVQKILAKGRWNPGSDNYNHIFHKYGGLVSHLKRRREPPPFFLIGFILSMAGDVKPSSNHLNSRNISTDVRTPIG